jgi:hypothetical protein
MPARPLQRKKKPFKLQRDLKYTRTMSRLRTYAKRRWAHGITTVIVLCTFLSRYMAELREWRAEQRRIAARPANKLRQRRHRKLKKIQARIARLQERRTQLTQEIAQLQECIRVKEWHLRTKATAQKGHVDGWQSAGKTPMTEAELEALSYSRRYIDAYLMAVAERRRIESAMQAQRDKSIVPAKLITL